jgi:hypothetical protein
MQHLYSLLASYEDIGVVTRFHDGETAIMRFHTYFVRPDQFKFESEHFRDEGDQIFSGRTLCLWSKDNKTYSRNSFSASPVCEENLLSAMAKFQSDTWGASLLVPSLLLPNQITQSTFLPLSEITTTAEKEIDGAECHRLIGTWAVANDTELWIEKTSYTLRKLIRGRQI